MTYDAEHMHACLLISHFFFVDGSSRANETVGSPHRSVLEAKEERYGRGRWERRDMKRMFWVGSGLQDETHGKGSGNGEERCGGSPTKL